MTARRFTARRTVLFVSPISVMLAAGLAVAAQGMVADGKGDRLPLACDPCAEAPRPLERQDDVPAGVTILMRTFAAPVAPVAAS